MKFKITLKDPDGVWQGIQDAAEASVKGSSFDESRREKVKARHEKIDKSLEKWVEYSEYITIEFDTEKKTATVCENS